MLRILPYFTAVLLFILVPSIYFLPVFQGLRLYQPDINHYVAVAKEIFDFRTRFHSEPLWTNSMFGGMPAYQVSILHPGNLVRYLYLFLAGWLPFPVSIVFLYCLGFFILLKTMNVNTWIAIAGSFGFAFSSYLFITLEAGHNSKANAIAFMAPVLAGVILSFNGKRFTGSVLFCVSLALELYSNHLQITFYLLMLIALYFCFKFIYAVKDKYVVSFFKTSGILVIAAVIAIGTNFSNLYLTYEYEKYSIRGESGLTKVNGAPNTILNEDYITQFSYGIPATMTLIIPDYVGGISESIGVNKDLLEGVNENFRNEVAVFSQYWGNQPFTNGPVYAGAVICFLALLGLLIVKGLMKYFLFAAILISIALSWGYHFKMLTDIFFHFLPGYNKFRSVSMNLVVTELCLPLLACLSLDKIYKNKEFFTEKIKPFFIYPEPIKGIHLFFIAVALAGGFTLLCSLTPRYFSNFIKYNEVKATVQLNMLNNPESTFDEITDHVKEVMPYVKQVRMKIFTSDARRSFLFIFIAALLVFFYSKFSVKTLPGHTLASFQEFIFVAGFILLVTLDMYPVDRRYLNYSQFMPADKVNEFKPGKSDIEILKDTSPDFRVLNTTASPETDGRTSYFHKSIGGYSAVMLKHYFELLKYQVEKGNRAVLNMLNTKYFIVADSAGGTKAVLNPGALGNAWFVDNYKVVEDINASMKAMDNINPAKTAVVTARYSSFLKDPPANAALARDTAATIAITSYAPNDITYYSHSSTSQLALFSEMYYKPTNALFSWKDGWRAYIDNHPSDYFKADYVLRAMYIPAGNHNIEFKFHPDGYYMGEKISLASSLLLALGCLVLFWVSLRK